MDTEEIRKRLNSAYYRQQGGNNERGEPFAAYYYRDVRTILDGFGRLLSVVEDFINQRPEYIEALKNSPEADADYWRWSGHAEARRQLTERLEMAIEEVNDDE